jgi:hypothetical protein
MYKDNQVIPLIEAAEKLSAYDLSSFPEEMAQEVTQLLNIAAQLSAAQGQQLTIATFGRDNKVDGSAFLVESGGWLSAGAADLLIEKDPDCINQFRLSQDIAGPWVSTLAVSESLITTLDKNLQPTEITVEQSMDFSPNP